LWVDGHNVRSLFVASLNATPPTIALIRVSEGVMRDLN